MLNKISVIKPGPLKSLMKEREYDNTQSISAIVAIEDFFTSVHYIFNAKQHVKTIQKKVVVNQKLSEIAKKIHVVKLIYEESKKSLSFIVATYAKVYIQDLEDPKNLRLLFNCSDNEELYITGFFEGNNLNNNFNKDTNPPYTIILVLNNGVLIEIDINKSESLSENTLYAFFNKGRAEGKTKCMKFEYYKRNTNQLSQSYSVLHNYDENKNVKSIWRFNNEKIISLKFRPKLILQDISTSRKENISKELYDNNNHIAVSFNGGKLVVYHYETKCIIFEYKTTYGNIICLEYSQDGRLLGLGTENDNVYILDAEFGGLIFCFEGHKNYVTSICFEEQITEDDFIDRNNALINKNTIYDSHDSNNYNSTSSHLQNPLMNKEVNADDFSKLFIEDDSNHLDLRYLRRTRTSVNPNVNFCINEELRSSSTFDVYTGGLDGCLGVWRIEHFYEEGAVNEKNYASLPPSKESMQVYRMEQPYVIQLLPKENIKVEFTTIEKVSKAPVNHIVMLDNALVLVCKRNIFCSFCYLSFYYGIVKTEESQINSSPPLDQHSSERKRSDLDSKVEKLNKTGVSGKSTYNIKIQTDSSHYTNTDSPSKERKNSSSVVPNARRVSTSNKEEAYANNTSIDKRGKSSAKK